MTIYEKEFYERGGKVTVLPPKKAKGVEKNMNKRCVASVGRKAISIGRKK
jgi:hypothetical protein